MVMFVASWFILIFLLYQQGEHVLDEVSDVCRFSLKTLKIVNITRMPLSMLAVSSFANLRCLIISPHNLGDDLVENICKDCTTQ